MPKKSKPQSQSGKHAIEIGIIGGSGLYSMPGLEKPREVRVKTPFGDPSDALIIGTLEGRRVAFLARHARGHRILAVRNQLSREYLRHENARRRANHFRQRGGFSERGFAAARISDPGPVL